MPFAGVTERVGGNAVVIVSGDYDCAVYRSSRDSNNVSSCFITRFLLEAGKSWIVVIRSSA